MKNKVILTAQHGRPSTKLVWSKVEHNCENPIVLVQRRRFTKRNGKVVSYYRVFGDPNVYNEKQLYQLKMKKFNFDNTVLIRWGTREEIEGENLIVYNQSKSIKNATDKKLSREIFAQNNVSTPRLLRSVNDWNNTWVIARPSVHSKGKNFVILKTKDELRHHWRQDWYYSEFVDKQREFRVHVGHSKVLALMEKHNPNNGNIAWNRAVNQNDPFTWVGQQQSDNENLKPVLIEAIKAVNALGLDMGGVDVMLQNGVAYVLEVNTAPTLNTSPKVANMWAKYWEFLLRRDDRRIHWNYAQFTKASSLFWKQNQLKE